MQPHRSSRATGLDALIWLLVPLGVLWPLSVGGLSGDGVAQSAMYLHGTWSANPNHLLYEPIGSAWLRLFHTANGLQAVDDLKRLSFLSGAISLALFRCFVAPHITTSRFAANLATVWLIAPAAVLGLWLSDETQIVQLPSLVILAAALVYCGQKPNWRRGFVVGIAGGIAGLFYISNAVICVSASLTLAVLLYYRRERFAAWKHLISSAVGGIVTLVPVLVGAWYVYAPSAMSFTHWITSYGGGAAVRQGAAGYGAQLSVKGVSVAVARAAYGAANALVDISQAISSLRDSGGLSIRAIASVVCLLLLLGLVAIIIAYMVRHSSDNPRWMFPVIIGWTAGVLAFAVYWNNSDDQFFFQLTVPLAVAVGAASRVRLWPCIVGLIVALGWNSYATVWPYVSYPREQYLDALEAESTSADLLVFPGEGEIGALLAFVPLDSTNKRISIAQLAARFATVDGLTALRDTVSQVVASGGRVSTIAIIDAPTDQNPWKYLRSLGYDHAAVNMILERAGRVCPVRDLGHWKARWIVKPTNARHAGASASQCEMGGAVKNRRNTER